MRLLFAYTYDPRPAAGETAEACFARLAGVVAGWAAGRAGVAVPTGPGEHQPADGVRAARSPTREADLYEVEVAAPDPADPTARRTTAVALARTKFGLQAAVRESVGLSRFVLRPVWFEVGRPAVVDDLLAAAPGFLGGYPIPTAARRVAAPFVPGLVDELLDERRALPVVVVTPSLATARPVVAPADLARDLLGLADVRELADKFATLKLTEAVGKDLSCFNGGVRVYWPGFTPEADRRDHKLFFPDDVAELAARGQSLGRHLFRLLVGAAGFRFADAPLVRIAREAVAAARQQEAQERIARLSVGAEEQRQIFAELERAWDENAALRKQVADLTAELADQKRAWNEVWQAARPADAPPPATPGPVRRPADALAQAAAEFPDVFEVLESASRSAGESPYRDPDRLLKLLRAVGELGREWKAGRLGKGWYHALRERGFEYKDDISMTAAGKFGAEYTFVYGGRPVLFENHVTLGASHNPQDCLSVHWYRDEEARRVVIGWCGKHLTNTKS